MASKKLIQVIAPKTNTNPAIFYVDHTAPADWPQDVDRPAPINFWRAALTPLTTGLGGLMLLSIAGVAVRQLFNRGGDDADSHNEEA